MFRDSVRVRRLESHLAHGEPPVNTGSAPFVHVLMNSVNKRLVAALPRAGPGCTPGSKEGA